MRANEIIPTITVTKRFLEIIALIKVGKDARRFFPVNVRKMSQVLSEKLTKPQGRHNNNWNEAQIFNNNCW